MHPARYDAALAACCLEQDMDQLVDGDATEIGAVASWVKASTNGSLVMVDIRYEVFIKAG